MKLFDAQNYLIKNQGQSKRKYTEADLTSCSYFKWLNSDLSLEEKQTKKPKKLKL